MAPKVSVPMDFGKHLIGSPTHSNLKLNTSKGGEVCASSVILSFNSPVIDHMTTSLHMTSVDMLEFGEAAVRLFVDAAYSGTAEGITRGTFREINKISRVFEVTWLAEKCVEYFTEVANSISTPSYTELLYLFEEAGFVFEKLKSKDFLNVTIKRIEMFKWKQQFINRYLENADRLSKLKLDMVIELAGTEVDCVVKTLTNELSELLKIQGSSLPLTHEYLLDNSNLYLCKKSDRVLFERLFEVLRELPDDKMRWTLDLHRKSTMKPTLLSNMTTLAKTAESGVNESSSLELPRCNTIANLYHNLDMTMTFDQLLDWINSSEEVTNVLMAVEAVCTWNCYRLDHGYNAEQFSVDKSVLFKRLSGIAEQRNWTLLPSDFHRFSVSFWHLRGISTSFPGLSEHCCVTNGEECRYVVVDCVNTCKKPLSLLSKDAKLTFHFKHPSVTSCNLPGECGFILKTVPSNAALWNLKLCSEEEDYQNEHVHFHDSIRAESMHVLSWAQVNYVLNHWMLLPISWLGWLHPSDVQKRSEWESQFLCSSAIQVGFKVLYELDTLPKNTR